MEVAWKLSFKTHWDSLQLPAHSLPVLSFIFLSWKKRNVLIRGLQWRLTVSEDSMIKWLKKGCRARAPVSILALLLPWCVRCGRNSLNPVHACTCK